MTKIEIINRLNEISLEIEELQMDLQDSEETARWTEKDAADAKAIKQLFPKTTHIGREGAYFTFFDDDGCVIEDELHFNILRSIEDDKPIRLDEIIGGAE